MHIICEASPKENPKFHSLRRGFRGRNCVTEYCDRKGCSFIRVYPMNHTPGPFWHRFPIGEPTPRRLRLLIDTADRNVVVHVLWLNCLPLHLDEDVFRIGFCDSYGYVTAPSDATHMFMVKK